MSDEQTPDIDLGAAHLRPAQRDEPRPERAPREDVVERIPWEGSRERGLAASYIATLWRVVRAPLASWAAVPTCGGVRRPCTFAMSCGVIWVVSQVIAGLTVALVRYGGRDAALAEMFQLDIAGWSPEWLPISVLSVAGCLLALVVAAPLYVFAYSLMVLLWTTVLHVLLKITGALSTSETGFEGTLRAVCYSQAAMGAAIVPWIGDEIAILWSLGLQVPGLVRMHGCSRARAALAVGLPAAALILALVLAILMAA
jgi:hypothetical protein